MALSSKKLQNAVDAFASLPGIGRKTALRLAMHLIRQDQDTVINRVVEPIKTLIQDIRFCSRCNNISDEEICQICKDRGGRATTLCIVENIRDLMAIEDTGQYHGVYHVLGGVISPLDGVSAQDLGVPDMIDRIKNSDIEEVILAISPTIEGDTTIYYISRQLQGTGIRVSQLARGISFGGELEYADEVTLGRSIITRTEYKINES